MARQLIRAAAAQSASFAYCARHCRCKSGFVSPTTATATVVTMTIKSSVLKPVVLALLALCVLQAVQASVAATTGTQVLLWFTLSSDADRDLYRTHNLTPRAIWADAGAMMDTGSSHRRDLKQAIGEFRMCKAAAMQHHSCCDSM